MISNKAFVRVEVDRGGIVQQLEVPEQDTEINRIRWWLAGIIAPIKVEWFE